MAFLSTELIERETKRIYLLTARDDMSESFYSKIGFYTSPKMILMARRIESEIANKPLHPTAGSVFFGLGLPFPPWMA